MDLDGGIQGLIHLSEISHGVVKDIKEFVKVGENVKAKIINFEPKKKRIGLSLKALTEAPKSAKKKAPKKDDSKVEGKKAPAKKVEAKTEGKKAPAKKVEAKTEEKKAPAKKVEAKTEEKKAPAKKVEAKTEEK
jgi:predicted RNA-binding protein with RPS1 domain